MNSILKTMLGVVFLLVGVAGILLPFLPGVVFLMLAVHCLGGDNWLKIRLNGMWSRNWRSNRLSWIQTKDSRCSRKPLEENK